MVDDLSRAFEGKSDFGYNFPPILKLLMTATVNCVCCKKIKQKKCLVVFVL